MPKTPTNKDTSKEELVAGLIRKSDVRYPDGCDTPAARETYEKELIQTRMAELVSDAARDGEAVTVWYIDLDVSGRAAFEHQRAGLHQLLADARAGRVRVLYARELSRIYRDTVKSILFKAEMEKLGVEVRARDMIKSAERSTETLVQTIQFAIDQFQAERTGEQIRSRNLQAFLADQWTGLARDMWGLRYDPAAKAYRYEAEGAARLCLVLETLVAERGNAYRAALALNAALQQGRPDATATPQGAAWCASIVLRLAESLYYRRCGQYAGRTRPQPHLIPEVVPPALLAEVDRVLALRRETVAGRRARSGREDYTYGPLMRCGDCGGRLKAQKYPAVQREERPEWLAWLCRRGADSRVLCPHSWSFTQTRLDRLVGLGLARALAEAQIHPPPDQKSRAAPRRKEPRQKDDPAAALAGLDAQIERTMRLYTSGLTSDLDWVQAEVRRLEERKGAVREQQVREEGEDPAPARSLSPAEWARVRDAIAACWRAGATVALDADKRDLLLSLGVSLSVRTLPRTKPPTNRGARRGTFRNTGGPLSVRMEVARLGRVGETALTLAETEEEWYDALCRSRNAWRGGGRP